MEQHEVLTGGWTAAATLEGRPMTESEWLAERRNSLGASEAAAALGVSPYATPIDLWQRKLGLAPDQAENEAMLWGKLLEPVVLAEYQRRTGREVVATQEFCRHPNHPFLTATLDARCSDGRLVEVKTAGAWAKEWGDEFSDQVPEPYLVQVAQQMAVTGAGVADVAVLLGGQQFRIYTVEREDGLVRAVEEGGVRFWRCVERRVPPHWGRQDAAALAVLNPGCSGEAQWGPEEAETVQEAVDRLEAHKADAKALEARIEHGKAVVLAAMGNARTGRLPDGRLLRRFLQEVGAKTVSYEAKAYTKHYFTVTKGER